MVKGGYQILNFNDTDFRVDIPMEINGIYDKIEGTRKAILISGLIIDGVELHDFYATPKVVGSSFVFDVLGYNVEISDIDIITVTKNDVIVIEPNILATGSYYAIDKKTYDKLTNISYDNIPNKIDITYTGVRYVSTVLSFNGEKISIVVNNVIVTISVQFNEEFEAYEIKLN